MAKLNRVFAIVVFRGGLNTGAHAVTLRTGVEPFTTGRKVFAMGLSTSSLHLPSAATATVINRTQAIRWRMCDMRSQPIAVLVLPVPVEEELEAQFLRDSGKPLKAI